MLLALSAGQKTGLALVAAAFIVFALASALWIPRFQPDFPGRGLRLFVGVTVLFTVGMLAAVIALGKEPKKPEKAAAPGTTATSPSATTAPAPTAPATSAPATTTAPPPGPPPAGNAQAGKQVFASAGCTACHTFTPAGSHGTVGPNLDHLTADAQKANRGSVQQYAHESIADPSAYVVPGFPNGVMPPNYESQLGAAKIDDLVAFLTQSQ